ncbi:MAG: divalent cation tolerance protein CutA [Flavobacteriales bacterium]|nr:divalent cation tolerance protein CutA [Flavobacteriales bacterium]
MIQLNIVVSTKEKAKDIITFLLKNQLATDISISPLEQYFQKKEELHCEQRFRVVSKTKSLLFEEIDQQVKSFFDDEIPEIYSTPIVNIDWDQANAMVKVLKKV